MYVIYIVYVVPVYVIWYDTIWYDMVGYDWKTAFHQWYPQNVRKEYVKTLQIALSTTIQAHTLKKRYRFCKLGLISRSEPITPVVLTVCLMEVGNSYHWLNLYIPSLPTSERVSTMLVDLLWSLMFLGSHITIHHPTFRQSIYWKNEMFMYI